MVQSKAGLPTVSYHQCNDPIYLNTSVLVQLEQTTKGVHYLPHAVDLWPSKNLGLVACEFICWVINTFTWALLRQPQLLVSLDHLMNCQKGQLHSSRLSSCSAVPFVVLVLSFSIHNGELISLMSFTKSAEKEEKLWGKKWLWFTKPVLPNVKALAHRWERNW